MEALKFSIPVETTEKTIQKIKDFVKNEGYRTDIGESERLTNVGKTMIIYTFNRKNNQIVFELGVSIGKIIEEENNKETILKTNQHDQI